MKKISKVAAVLAAILALALGCTEQTDGGGAIDSKKDSTKTQPKPTDDNEVAEMEFISLKVTGMT